MRVISVGLVLGVSLFAAPRAWGSSLPFCGEFDSYDTGEFPAGITTGDVNSDGLVDIVVANQAGYSVSVFLSNGDMTFQTRRDIPVGVAPVELAICDLDRD